ncbi:hypothetical protein D3C85_1734200 [compost metagenome]
MGAAGRVRPPERFRYHRALAIEHEAVQFESGVVDRRHEIDDTASVDTPLVGQGSGQGDIGHEQASSKLPFMLGNVFIFKIIHIKIYRSLRSCICTAYNSVSG